MYEYFQRLLDERGVSAADVCKATGIGSGTISTWKKRNSMLNMEYLKRIAVYFGVSTDYFCDGREYHADFITDKISKDLPELNGMDNHVLIKYVQLDDEDKWVVDSLIETLYAKDKYKKAIPDSEVG